MLHKRRVLRALYYAMRRRVRVALGRAARPQPPPVLSQSLEAVVERHSGIARALLKNLPAGLDLTGKNACEIGSGDCLAVIALMLGLGARHVDVFEIAEPVVNEKQAEVIGRLKSAGLPVDVNVIRRGSGLELDAQRVTFHKGYMENFKGSAVVDFVFSFSVLEHVEDLDGFFRECFRIMTAGAHMLHVIDLGGHEAFEDPLPPLDFQTYSDGLFELMYPRYRRATRRFVSDYKAAAKRNGFQVLEIKPVRTASAEYLDEIWPKLRAGAKARPREEVAVIEFALTARKEG
jgi:SAM-dependent methyltransferase